MVENLFSGGNGWALSPSISPSSPRSHRAATPYHDDDDTSGSLSGDEGYGGTLRPSDFRRAQRHVARKLVNEPSSRTLRDDGGKGREGGGRSRSGSLASLAPTLGSSEREREREGSRGAREVSETEARDDMVAWRLSGRV